MTCPKTALHGPIIYRRQDFTINSPMNMREKQLSGLSAGYKTKGDKG